MKKSFGHTRFNSLFSHILFYLLTCFHYFYVFVIATYTVRDCEMKFMRTTYERESLTVYLLTHCSSFLPKKIERKVEWQEEREVNKRRRKLGKR